MASPLWTPDSPDLIVEADNLDVLRSLPDGTFTMIYVDPPFNTGILQQKRTTKAVATESGAQEGFGGKKYNSVLERIMAYNDSFVDYWGFLGPRLEEIRRVLTDDGTLYVHLDYREVHYAKVFLDSLFGRDCFLNEIIWAYDYGGKSKSKWPAKHDNILVYVKHPKKYHFNSGAVDREPYMAPGLVTPEKAALGKLPTDVWWHTIVSPTGKEKTGYPTQKPRGILRRMLTASSREGDWVADFFAGSGPLGVVAREGGRRFLLTDSNPEAIDVMSKVLTPAPKNHPLLISRPGQAA